MSRNENGRGRCVNTTVPGLTPLLTQEGAAVMVANERPAEGTRPTPITDAEFIKATLDYHWTRFVGEAHPEMSHHEAACNFDDVVEAYRRENGMPPGTPPPPVVGSIDNSPPRAMDFDLTRDMWESMDRP